MFYEIKRRDYPPLYNLRGKMFVMGLGFKMKRGKDTLAQFLIDMRGAHTPWKLDIRRYAFADYLKQEVNLEVEKLVAQQLINNGETSRDVMGREYISRAQSAMQAICEKIGVKYDPNPPMDDPFCPFGKQRRLLQWWGTEYRRAQDPDYWLKILWKSIFQDQPDVAIITDVRFPNEFHSIKAHPYGRTLRLERLNFSDPAENHASETSLEGFPWDGMLIASSIIQLKQLGLVQFDSWINEVSV